MEIWWNQYSYRECQFSFSPFINLYWWITTQADSKLKRLTLNSYQKWDTLKLEGKNYEKKTNFTYTLFLHCNFPPPFLLPISHTHTTRTQSISQIKIRYCKTPTHAWISGPPTPFFPGLHTRKKCRAPITVTTSQNERQKKKSALPDYL